MLPARGKIAKAVVLRPGALGDVLAVRGVIAMLRRAFPGVHIGLAAPGERGRFLCRPGWADQWLDWDRAAFAWLFAAGAEAPPAALQAAFAGADFILAYVDQATDLEDRLRRLAPAASLLLSPSRPPPGAGQPIGEWLTDTLGHFLEQCSLPTGPARDVPAIHPDPAPLPPRPYMVIHPGSGGPAKNWPVDAFAALARLTLDAIPGLGLVVTSGEADALLGERLAAAVPGALSVHQPPLERLAAILAHAAVYIGNDSGVSHLAAAVAAPDSGPPRCAVLFGPSDPAVWAPPGAVVLTAGPDMASLTPAAAWRRIQPLFDCISR